jgi:hypothetical protein
MSYVLQKGDNAMNLGMLKTITLVQVLAVIGWAGAQAVAFGVVDQQHEKIIMSAGATIVAAVWKAADAWIHTTTIKSQPAAVQARAAQHHKSTH